MTLYIVDTTKYMLSSYFQTSVYLATFKYHLLLLLVFIGRRDTSNQAPVLQGICCSFVVCILIGDSDHWR